MDTAQKILIIGGLLMVVRGPGLALGFLQAPLHTVGVAILAVGCLQAL